MRITRLRLMGFKSFVEPTDLVVEPGLTGVVGPNGCGKSNLLEALRWVMGETSHKSMRAAAMDDVIFSGTSHRPARNTAEVTIVIDNTARRAPAEFNDAEVIEVTRRIEREAGSAYRINGADVRARDVKLLFEDAATGARSPALVRQGQISEIVNAKPEQRRRVLEDAAGIAGLHTRRHEAELRLRAAEGNLARIDDVLGGLGSQIEALKRQARAARRYRDLSGEIRRLEAILLHLRWAEAHAQVEAEEHALTDVLTRVGLATRAEASALSKETELAATLEPLRQDEAIRAAVLARLAIAQESFEAEATRAAARRDELAGRRDQLAADAEREDAHATEARETLARLTEELSALEDAVDDTGPDGDDLADRLAAAEAALRTADAAAVAATHRAAESRAHRRSLLADVENARAAAVRIERQVTGFDAQLRDVAARAPDAERLALLDDEIRALEDEISAGDDAALEAEAARIEEAATAAARREAAATARLTARALSAERETLAGLLAPPPDEDDADSSDTGSRAAASPVADSLVVAAGLETALGAALGADLEAPVIADAAGAHWRTLEAQSGEPADPRLPDGIEPLARHIEAPQALRRRLAQIGLVDRSAGARLQATLKPGQRLVSREGDLWRWDGLVAPAGGATAAAQRLELRNRLADVTTRAAEAETRAQKATAAEAAATAALAQTEARERALRQAAKTAQARLAHLRGGRASLAEAARETAARLAGIEEARVRAADELLEAHERRIELEATLDHLEEDDALGETEADARAHAEARRAVVGEIRAEAAARRREAEFRSSRILAARTERDRWRDRMERAQEQTARIAARRTETERELSALADLPDQLAGKRSRLLSEIAEAERARRAAADRLAQTDTEMREAREALRTAQAALAVEREARARIEAKLEAARARRAEEARRIRDDLDADPEGCLAIAGLTEGAALPAIAEADRDLVRLKTDRERLGGVNLAADDELQALAGEHERLETERADVEQAINKLRGAIGALNREGRKRLQEAFETVDGHFQRLFSTLFGGGEARLELVESEDPLESGLEIMARPPGKKPATLSLLSGGEQTLTALSLIFAVFLTNPSPICVLDEVDAPLDDANVDRFCTLMEHMAEDTDTRFLVITHHPMTMARMNRLFGVTMAERGVSQLVSVDLEQARTYLEAV